jgi:hypothetical protein
LRHSASPQDLFLMADQIWVSNLPDFNGRVNTYYNYLKQKELILRIGILRWFALVVFNSVHAASSLASGKIAYCKLLLFYQNINSSEFKESEIPG